MAQFTNSPQVGRSIGRKRVQKAVSSEFVVPNDTAVETAIVDAEMGEEQAESFAGLVACAIVGINDGYTAWVPKWKLQSEGINVAPLYELVSAGAVKIGNGTFAASIMLPVRGTGASRGRKDARVSDIMRSFRPGTRDKAVNE